MAIYKIASLNYLTAGKNRAFLNIDTVLDYELYRPVYILRNEEPYISAGTEEAIRDMVSTPLSVLCSDIVTEQRDGYWYKTEYLARECASRSNTEANAFAAAQDSVSVVLNERQKYYMEYEDGHRMYIRLYPPGTDDGTIRMIDDFNAKRRHINRTFVLDTDLASRRQAGKYDGCDSSLNNMNLSGGDILYPAYDMVDVHVKSADTLDSRGNLMSFDAAVTGKREDIYLPQLTKDPIGCCQLQSDAFMLTEATAMEPGMLKSSLHRERKRENIGRTYTVQINSEGVKTYLYGKTSDGVADVQGTPQANVAGIEYNNITQFPQNDIKVGYSEGNEYGYMIRGKNAMDSRYNMVLRKTGSQVSAYGCRDYADIGQIGGDQLYFKFYDGAVYTGVSSDSVIAAERTRSEIPVVPYQKIECAYVNRYTSANMHKTRFFSIKLLNTELNQYNGVSDDDLKENRQDVLRKGLYAKIMQDIGCAVKEIAENLCPAHTQLYKVMFDE